jgi:hypothetical protein
VRLAETGGRTAVGLPHLIDSDWKRFAMFREDISGLVTRVESEYREMPGLQLTERQMQRLWGLDMPTCHEIIGILVSRCILVKTQRGSYGLLLSTP